MGRKGKGWCGGVRDVRDGFAWRELGLGGQWFSDGIFGFLRRIWRLLLGELVFFGCGGLGCLGGCGGS